MYTWSLAHHKSQWSSWSLSVLDAQELKVEALPVVKVFLRALDGSLLKLNDDILAGSHVTGNEAQREQEEPHLKIFYHPVVYVIKLYFGGNIDFPKIKKRNKVCSDV